MKEIIKNTTAADRLLFIFLISITIAGMFISREAISQGSEVLVEIDGKPAYTFPINTDRTIPVKGIYWDSVVEIKDKRVRIKEALCPNRICVKQGWISKGVIVCLPNKIVVFVRGKGNNHKEELDAITG